MGDFIQRGRDEQVVDLNSLRDLLPRLGTSDLFLYVSLLLWSLVLYVHSSER